MLKLGQLRRILNQAGVEEKDVQTVIIALDVLSRGQTADCGNVWVERAREIVDPH